MFFFFFSASLVASWLAYVDDAVHLTTVYNEAAAACELSPQKETKELKMPSSAAMNVFLFL